MQFKKWSIIAALLAAVALPGAAHAQFNFEGRGGAGVPAGDLADLADVGGSAGFGVGYLV